MRLCPNSLASEQPRLLLASCHAEVWGQMRGWVLGPACPTPPGDMEPQRGQEPVCSNLLWGVSSHTAFITVRRLRQEGK